MTARVRDAGVREPFYVDGALDLVSVCRVMSQHGLSQALVRDGERVGMFTTTDLRDALLRAGAAAAAGGARGRALRAGRPGARCRGVRGLALMLRHRVHRLLVRDGDDDRSACSASST